MCVQTNEQLADMNDPIEMVRSVAALERKAVIADALPLTGEESTEFWPIYDKYAADKKRVNDRLVKIITDYAANFENLSDKLATSLVGTSKAICSMFAAGIYASSTRCWHRRLSRVFIRSKTSLMP